MNKFLKIIKVCAVIENTVEAVFKSADSIVQKSFLLRTILQRGLNCGKDCIALATLLNAV